MAQEDILQQSVDWIFYSLAGLDKVSVISQAANFFVYDSVKVVLLLFFMITLIGFLRTYISSNHVRKWLGGKKEGLGNLAASIFGAITPFCSCSSIPMFMGFLKSGVPVGVTFSFLITSPIINEYLVVLMLGFFGWKITAAYVISGILIGTLCGIALGRLGVEKYVKKEFRASNGRASEMKYKSLLQRIEFGINESWCILKRLWIWILVGVGLGAIIHNFIPQQLIETAVNATGFFAVPIAVLIGVPMYGSCAAIVPIAVVLFEKGVPLGTALAFMMAVSALSLPEFVILKRVMKTKLLLLFFGIVTLGILITGFIFNFLQNVLV